VRDPSKLIDLAARFRRHSEPFRSFGLKGQADLYAEKGREAWGIWRLIPKNRETESAWVTFSLLASLALEEFGILPTPAPQPLEFDPSWRSAEDIPAGLDAVDACTRAWLHFLRCESLRNGSLIFKVRSAGGSFPDVWEASAVQCERSAQAKIQERLNTDDRAAALDPAESSSQATAAPQDGTKSELALAPMADEPGGGGRGSDAPLAQPSALAPTDEELSPTPESATSDRIEVAPLEPSGQVAQAATRLVTVIRNAGTATETRREIRMGGDFTSTALFNPEDGVIPGEEIHHELFDEPRIVTRGNPIGTRDGMLFRWEAEIMPRSEWKRRDGENQLRHFGDFNPPVLAAFLQRNEYPKHLYHKTLLAVIALNADEEANARAQGYGDAYVRQDYPKWKHHWNKDSIEVKSAEEDAALGGGWANNVSDFEAFRDAKHAGPPPDPVKWLDQWSVPGLSPAHRTRIKAELLEAHAAFWKSPDAPTAVADAMRKAFDGIAKVLFEAGILTVELLGKEMPELVWDSAIAGGWWYLASETRKEIFPEQLGHYWIWRDESRDWQTLFRAETAEWRARLLEHPKAKIGKPRPAVGNSPSELAAAARRGPARGKSELAAAGADSAAGKKQSKVGKIRSAWLDEQRSQKQWSSDLDIARCGGPTYNTIRRFRSGKTSTRDCYVRGRLAKTFGCEITAVPE
jgi:hypothetical protein